MRLEFGFGKKTGVLLIDFLEKSVLLLPSHRDLAAGRGVMHGDDDRPAADVAVFDVLNGFIGRLGFDVEGFVAVGTGDGEGFVHLEQLFTPLFWDKALNFRVSNRLRCMTAHAARPGVNF